jgi:hypothetical protein
VRATVLERIDLVVGIARDDDRRVAVQAIAVLTESASMPE